MYLIGEVTAKADIQQVRVTRVPRKIKPTIVVSIWDADGRQQRQTMQPFENEDVVVMMFGDKKHSVFIVGLDPRGPWQPPSDRILVEHKVCRDQPKFFAITPWSKKAVRRAKGRQNIARNHKSGKN